MAAIKEKVTMKTIAEEAGVTLTTVSRILNNKGGKYAEKTKKQIFEIAERLKYRPNALVHGMQSGRTNTAGVMIPILGQFYAEIVRGIHRSFSENDTIMLLGWNTSIKGGVDDTKERHIIHQLIDRRVDGVILRPSCEAFERSYFEEIWEREIPLILIDREMTKVTADFVGTDDEAGGRLATQFLIELGHRRLLFVGSGEQVSTSRYREVGFRDVLSESPNACGRSIDNEKPDFREELVHLMKQDDRPTALFCYSDPTAELVSKILLEEGISIPGDVSLLGFGNQASGILPFPLTTFDQHPLLIGETAAEIYLERVNEDTRSGIRHERITPDIVVRASTGPLH
jgi:LacI family transcriptional regulator